MNIMYLLFSFTVGGIERLMVDIANGMSKKHNVTVCVINDYYSPELINELNDRVNVILMKRPIGSSKVKCMFDVYKEVRKVKPDVLHCQGMNCIQASILVKVLMPKVKIYNTVHDVNNYKKYNKLQVILGNIMCEKILAISKAVEKEILDKKVPDSKVEVVYNSIDTDRFKCSKRKKFDKNNVVIGSVARIYPQKKGQDLLIRAVAVLCNRGYNIKCIFAGEPMKGNMKYIDELIKLAESLNVDDKVDFLGNVMNVPKVIEQTDIFALSSRFEGFGISIIEAMAMERLCVVCDIEGPKEIVRSEKLGYTFKTGDYIDLADKLEAAINNYNSFDFDYIRSYVEDKYSIKNMLVKLERIYGLG